VAAARRAGGALAALVDDAVAVLVERRVAHLGARDLLAEAGAAPARAGRGHLAALDAGGAEAHVGRARGTAVAGARLALEALAALVGLAVAVVVDSVTALVAGHARAAARVPGAELEARGAV